MRHLKKHNANKNSCFIDGGVLSVKVQRECSENKLSREKRLKKHGVN